jgi:uncharacterized protein (TIGR00369 family)
MKRDTSHFITQNSDFKNTIIQKLDGQHFMHHIGAKLTVIEKAYIEAELQMEQQHLQQAGFTHGGVTATLCDLVTGFAAFSLVALGEAVVTADLKVSYLNPGDGDKLIAKGWVNKPGQMLHFCEGEVWISKAGELTQIAHCTALMAVVKNLQKRD